MTDEELRKIDQQQLLAEQEVLEDLLRAKLGHPHAGFWREELNRVNKSLKGLFLSVDS